MSKNIDSILEQAIKKALQKTGLPDLTIKLEHPTEETHGDYATNMAMLIFSKSKAAKFKNPGQIAGALVEQLKKDKHLAKIVSKIEIAGPGFINFHLSSEFLINKMYQYIDIKDGPLKFARRPGQKIMIEFAHPNTHKPFHIGHLRNISLGESLSRILTRLNHEIICTNYQGDVGLHIAKCLFQIQNAKFKMQNFKGKTLDEKIKFLGQMYAKGNQAYETDQSAKKQIIDINRQIYEKDAQIMPLWKETRAWSLAYFDKIYQRLDSKFDRLYFESEMLEGAEIAKKAVKKGILAESFGAIVFRGDKYGLDTRVFINSAGLPTYEAKELKLAELEFSEFGQIDQCIHVVGPEQKSFFQVTFKVEELLDPKKYKNKQYHLSYGYVRLKKGKMSSRTGTIIEANWLLDEVKKRLQAEFRCSQETAEIIAVGAVKYSMLKINPQSDLIFDINESISLAGNSGPYLQYTYARAQSVLRKAQMSNARLPDGQVKAQIHKLNVKTLKFNEEEMSLLRTIYQFPEVVLTAGQNYSPNLIGNFLFDLCQRYNLFYQKCPILRADKETKNFRLALTIATSSILKSSLNLLGIKVLEKM